MLKRALAMGAMVAAIGCGGDGELTGLEGIYELSSWTANPDGCDAEGPSILESQIDTHVFLRADAFFGQRFVNVVRCESLEQCRTDAADSDTLFLGGFIFETGSDSDGWTGHTTVLFGDSCDGTVDRYHLTGEPGDALTIEQETRSVMDVPLDSEGDCDFDAARAQAEGKPCEELEVITATFVEPI